MTGIMATGHIKFKGIEYQKFFSDGGDPQEALVKARHWRKLKLQTLQVSDIADVMKQMTLPCREA